MYLKCGGHIYYNIQMEKMLEKFSKLRPQQWKTVTQLPTELNLTPQTKIVHCITNEEFHFKKIDLLHKFKNSKSVADYFARSVSSLPGTPRVIVPDRNFLSAGCNSFEVLVQTSSEDLDFFFKKLTVPQLIYTLRNLLFTLKMLIAKYGVFKLTKKMLLPTANGQVLIWHNQDFSENKIQIKDKTTLKNECKQKRMLLNLISVLSSITDLSQHQQFLSFTRKKILITSEATFNQTIRMLAIYPQLIFSPKPEDQLKNSECKTKKEVPTFLRNRVTKKILDGRNNGQGAYKNLQIKRSKANYTKKADLSNQISESTTFQIGTKSMLECPKNQQMKMKKTEEDNEESVMNKTSVSSWKKSTNDFGRIVKSTSQYLVPEKLLKKSSNKSPYKSMSELHSLTHIQSPKRNKQASTASGSTRGTYTLSTKFEQGQINKMIDLVTSDKQCCLGNQGKITEIPHIKQSKEESKLTYAMQEIQNDILAVLNQSPDRTIIIQKDFSSIQQEIQNVLFG